MRRTNKGGWGGGALLAPDESGGDAGRLGSVAADHHLDRGPISRARQRARPTLAGPNWGASRDSWNPGGLGRRRRRRACARPAAWPLTRGRRNSRARLGPLRHLERARLGPGPVCRGGNLSARRPASGWPASQWGGWRLLFGNYTMTHTPARPVWRRRRRPEQVGWLEYQAHPAKSLRRPSASVHKRPQLPKSPRPGPARFKRLSYDRPRPAGRPHRAPWLSLSLWQRQILDERRQRRRRRQLAPPASATAGPISLSARGRARVSIRQAGAQAG